MLSAEQAKYVADLTQKDMVNKELYRLLLSVEQQSNCGGYSCNCGLNRSLSKETIFEVKSKLESLGYKVNYYDGYGATNYFQISWDK